MSKLAQDISSVGAELFEGRLAQDINSVDAELVQQTQELVLTSPANGDTGVALSATFTWTDSESRGLYRLVYDTDINFGSPTVVWTETTSHNATLTSGTYYWKVEAHNTVQQDAIVPDDPYLDSRAGDEAWASDFYTATGGDTWDDNTGWNGGTVSLADDPFGLTIETIGGELRITEVKFKGTNLDRGNNLTGQVPDSMGNLKKCTFWSVKGNSLDTTIPEGFYYMESLKYAEWCATSRTTLTPWDYIEDGNLDDRSAYIHEGKGDAPTNLITGTLSSEIGRLTNLECIQLQYAYLLGGEIPTEVGQLTNLKFWFANGTNMTGSIPSEFSNCTNLSRLYVQNSSLSNSAGYTGAFPSELNACPIAWFFGSGNQYDGPFPVMDNWTDLRLLQYGDFTDNAGPFPTWIFDNVNENNRLATYSGATWHTLPLPDDVEIADTGNISTLNFDNAIDHIGEPGWNVPLPTWVPDILSVSGVIQFQLQNTGWTGDFPYADFEGLFYNLRLFWVHNNNFTGELPDNAMAKVVGSGTITNKVSNTVVETDKDFEAPIKTGTIVGADGVAEYFQSDTDVTERLNTNIHLCRIIVPDGEDIIFPCKTNTTVSPFIRRADDDTTDLSNVEGFDYEITLITVDRLVRVKIAENSYRARFVDSVSGSTVTFDDPITDDINGSEIEICTLSTEFGANMRSYQAENNNFTGKIPETTSRFQTDREVLRIWFFNNELDGLIPDFTNVGKPFGGSALDVRVQDNKFTPKDILPNLTANNTLPTFIYLPQKPFNEPISASPTIGSFYQINLDEYGYIGNTYQWYKDDVAISGETEAYLTFDSISESDYGVYKMEIEHPDINYTFVSNNIVLTDPDTQEFQN